MAQQKQELKLGLDPQTMKVSIAKTEIHHVKVVPENQGPDWNHASVSTPNLPLVSNVRYPNVGSDTLSQAPSRTAVETETTHPKMASNCQKSHVKFVQVSTPNVPFVSSVGSLSINLTNVLQHYTLSQAPSRTAVETETTHAKMESNCQKSHVNFVQVSTPNVPLVPSVGSPSGNLTNVLQPQSVNASGGTEIHHSKVARENQNVTLSSCSQNKSAERVETEIFHPKMALENAGNHLSDVTGYPHHSLNNFSQPKISSLETDIPNPKLVPESREQNLFFISACSTNPALTSNEGYPAVGFSKVSQGNVNVFGEETKIPTPKMIPENQGQDLNYFPVSTPNLPLISNYGYPLLSSSDYLKPQKMNVSTEISHPKITPQKRVLTANHPGSTVGTDYTSVRQGDISRSQNVGIELEQREIPTPKVTLENQKPDLTYLRSCAPNLPHATDTTGEPSVSNTGQNTKVSAAYLNGSNTAISKSSTLFENLHSSYLKHLNRMNHLYINSAHLMEIANLASGEIPKAKCHPSGTSEVAGHSIIESAYRTNTDTNSLILSGSTLFSCDKMSSVSSNVSHDESCGGSHQVDEREAGHSAEKNHSVCGNIQKVPDSNVPYNSGPSGRDHVVELQTGQSQDIHSFENSSILYSAITQQAKNDVCISGVTKQTANIPQTLTPEASGSWTEMDNLPLEQCVPENEEQSHPAQMVMPFDSMVNAVQSPASDQPMTFTALNARKPEDQSVPMPDGAEEPGTMACRDESVESDDAESVSDTEVEAQPESRLRMLLLGLTTGEMLDSYFPSEVRHSVSSVDTAPSSDMGGALSFRRNIEARTVPADGSAGGGGTMGHLNGVSTSGTDFLRGGPVGTYSNGGHSIGTNITGEYSNETDLNVGNLVGTNSNGVSSVGTNLNRGCLNGGPSVGTYLNGGALNLKSSTGGKQLTRRQCNTTHPEGYSTNGACSTTEVRSRTSYNEGDFYGSIRDDRDLNGEGTNNVDIINEGGFHGRHCDEGNRPMEGSHGIYSNEGSSNGVCRENADRFPLQAPPIQEKKYWTHDHDQSYVQATAASGIRAQALPVDGKGSQPLRNELDIKSSQPATAVQSLIDIERMDRIKSLMACRPTFNGACKNAPHTRTTGANEQKVTTQSSAGGGYQNNPNGTCRLNKDTGVQPQRLAAELLTNSSEHRNFPDQQNCLAQIVSDPDQYCIPGNEGTKSSPNRIQTIFSRNKDIDLCRDHHQRNGYPTVVDSCNDERYQEFSGSNAFSSNNNGCVPYSDYGIYPEYSGSTGRQQTQVSSATLHGNLIDFNHTTVSDKNGPITPHTDRTMEHSRTSDKEAAVLSVSAAKSELSVTNQGGISKESPLLMLNRLMTDLKGGLCKEMETNQKLVEATKLQNSNKCEVSERKESSAGDCFSSKLNSKSEFRNQGQLVDPDGEICLSKTIVKRKSKKERNSRKFGKDINANHTSRKLDSEQKNLYRSKRFSDDSDLDSRNSKEERSVTYVSQTSGCGDKSLVVVIRGNKSKQNSSKWNRNILQDYSIKENQRDRGDNSQGLPTCKSPDVSPLYPVIHPDHSDIVTGVSASVDCKATGVKQLKPTRAGVRGRRKSRKLLQAAQQLSHESPLYAINYDYTVSDYLPEDNPNKNGVALKRKKKKQGKVQKQQQFLLDDAGLLSNNTDSSVQRCDTGSHMMKENRTQRTKRVSVSRRMSCTACTVGKHRGDEKPTRRKSMAPESPQFYGEWEVVDTEKKHVGQNRVDTIGEGLKDGSVVPKCRNIVECVRCKGEGRKTLAVSLCRKEVDLWFKQKTTLTREEESKATRPQRKRSVDQSLTNSQVQSKDKESDVNKEDCCYNFSAIDATSEQYICESGKESSRHIFPENGMAVLRSRSREQRNPLPCEVNRASDGETWPSSVTMTSSPAENEQAINPEENAEFVYEGVTEEFLQEQIIGDMERASLFNPSVDISEIKQESNSESATKHASECLHDSNDNSGGVMEGDLTSSSKESEMEVAIRDNKSSDVENDLILLTPHVRKKRKKSSKYSLSSSASDKGLRGSSKNDGYLKVILKKPRLVVDNTPLPSPTSSTNSTLLSESSMDVKSFLPEPFAEPRKVCGGMSPFVSSSTEDGVIEDIPFSKMRRTSNKSVESEDNVISTRSGRLVKRTIPEIKETILESSFASVVLLGKQFEFTTCRVSSSPYPQRPSETVAAEQPIQVSKSKKGRRGSRKVKTQHNRTKASDVVCNTNNNGSGIDIKSTLYMLPNGDTVSAQGGFSWDNSERIKQTENSVISIAGADEESCQKNDTLVPPTDKLCEETKSAELVNNSLSTLNINKDLSMNKNKDSVNINEDSCMNSNLDCTVNSSKDLSVMCGRTKDSSGVSVMCGQTKDSSGVLSDVPPQATVVEETLHAVHSQTGTSSELKPSNLSPVNVVDGAGLAPGDDKSKISCERKRKIRGVSNRKRKKRKLENIIKKQKDVRIQVQKIDTVSETSEYVIDFIDHTAAKLKPKSCHKTKNASFVQTAETDEPERMNSKIETKSVDLNKKIEETISCCATEELCETNITTDTTTADKSHQIRLNCETTTDSQVKNTSPQSMKVRNIFSDIEDITTLSKDLEKHSISEDNVTDRETDRQMAVHNLFCFDSNPDDSSCQVSSKFLDISSDPDYESEDEDPIVEHHVYSQPPWGLHTMAKSNPFAPKNWSDNVSHTKEVTERTLKNVLKHKVEHDHGNDADTETDTEIERLNGGKQNLAQRNKPAFHDRGNDADTETDTETEKQMFRKIDENVPNKTDCDDIDTRLKTSRSQQNIKPVGDGVEDVGPDQLQAFYDTVKERSITVETQKSNEKDRGDVNEILTEKPEYLHNLADAMVNKLKKQTPSANDTLPNSESISFTKTPHPAIDRSVSGENGRLNICTSDTNTIVTDKKLHSECAHGDDISENTDMYEENVVYITFTDSCVENNTRPDSGAYNACASNLSVHGNAASLKHSINSDMTACNNEVHTGKDKTACLKPSVKTRCPVDLKMNSPESDQQEVKLCDTTKRSQENVYCHSHDLKNSMKQINNNCDKDAFVSSAVHPLPHSGVNRDDAKPSHTDVMIDRDAEFSKRLLCSDLHKEYSSVNKFMFPVKDTRTVRRATNVVKSLQDAEIINSDHSNNLSSSSQSTKNPQKCSVPAKSNINEDVAEEVGVLNNDKTRDLQQETFEQIIPPYNKSVDIVMDPRTTKTSSVEIHSAEQISLSQMRETEHLTRATEPKIPDTSMTLFRKTDANILSQTTKFGPVDSNKNPIQDDFSSSFAVHSSFSSFETPSSSSGKDLRKLVGVVTPHQFTNDIQDNSSRDISAETDDEDDSDDPMLEQMIFAYDLVRPLGKTKFGCALCTAGDGQVFGSVVTMLQHVLQTHCYCQRCCQGFPEVYAYQGHIWSQHADDEELIKNARKLAKIRSTRNSMIPKPPKLKLCYSPQCDNISTGYNCKLCGKTLENSSNAKSHVAKYHFKKANWLLNKGPTLDNKKY